MTHIHTKLHQFLIRSIFSVFFAERQTDTQTDAAKTIPVSLSDHYYYF